MAGGKAGSAPLRRWGDSLLEECGISLLISSLVSVKLEAKQSGKFEDWGAGLDIGRKEGKRSRKIKVTRLGKFSRATKEPEVLPEDSQTNI